MNSEEQRYRTDLDKYIWSETAPLRTNTNFGDHMHVVLGVDVLKLCIQCVQGQDGTTGRNASARIQRKRAAGLQSLQELGRIRLCNLTSRNQVKVGKPRLIRICIGNPISLYTFCPTCIEKCSFLYMSEAESL